MERVRRIGLLFMISFLTSAMTFAQERGSQKAAVSGDGIYWQASSAGGKILNKSNFGDNWFVGLECGTLFNWGTMQSEHDFVKHFRPMGAVQLGKWLSPSIGLRVQGYFANNSDVQGADNAGKYNWNTIGAFLDGMFNFTNMFCGYKESRAFNLIGIIGMGGDFTNGFTKQCPATSKNDSYLSGRIGLMCKFRLSEALDFDAEATNAWDDDAYDGQINTNRWDGHVNVLLGLTYRFKNHDGSHQFTYARYDGSKFNAMNNEINDLNGKLAAAKNAPAKVETQYVNGNRVNTVIAFARNSSSIDKLQEVNVFTAAESLKKAAGADLYITVNGEVPARNKDLFMERAQSIRDALVKQYNIPAGRIYIENDPAVVASLDKSKRCVVVLVNE